MEYAGQRLRRERERLGLRFRDVETFSQQIADRHNNPDFVVLISRLSDIESHGVLPSIYRLYSLCCIYRLDLIEVLGWFGIPVDSMTADAGMVQIEKTHSISMNPDGAEVMLPDIARPGNRSPPHLFRQRSGAALGQTAAGALVAGMDVKTLSLWLRRNRRLEYESCDTGRRAAGDRRFEAPDSDLRLAQSGGTAHLFSGASRWTLLPVVQCEGRYDQPDCRSVLGRAGADVPREKKST